jgi:hypothetical protein
MKDGSPYAFAALWDRWRDPATKEPLETFTVTKRDIKPAAPRACRFAVASVRFFTFGVVSQIRGELDSRPPDSVVRAREPDLPPRVESGSPESGIPRQRQCFSAEL